jgi:hypothetical protein
LKLKVTSNDPEFISLVASKDSDAIFRLIMAGSESHSKLHRLYDGDEAKEYIQDAKHILWHIGAQKESSNEVSVSVTSSVYWLDSYEAEDAYDVHIDIDIYNVEDHV